MRFLAFTDIHGDKLLLKVLERKIKLYKPDFFICAGDLTLFGYNMAEIVDHFASWKLPGYIIHGNHEIATNLQKCLAKHKHLHSIHGKITAVGDLHIVGFGGGGFSTKDVLFRKFIDSHKKELTGLKNVILVTHAPPKNTALDIVHGEHVGCMTQREFVNIVKGTLLAFAGHIHECFGKTEKMGQALWCNPGPKGRIFDVKEGKVSIVKE